MKPGESKMPDQLGFAYLHETGKWKKCKSELEAVYRADVEAILIQRSNPVFSLRGCDTRTPYLLNEMNNIREKFSREGWPTNELDKADERLNVGGN